MRLLNRILRDPRTERVILALIMFNAVTLGLESAPRVSLRLFETQSVHIDTGDGLRELPLHTVGGGPTDSSPAPFTGDRAVRALGWRRGAEQPPWRIQQDTPLPCALLSATTEVKVN